MQIRYHTIAPPAVLAPYVRFYWVLEGSLPPGMPYVYRSMADGCAELLFHYHNRFDELYADGSEAPSFTSGLHGPARKYSRFRVQKGFGIFGAYLYPFALQALLGIPATEFSNRLVSLNELPGNEGRELEERIMLAADNEQRVRILSAFLEKKVRAAQQELPFVAAAIRHIIHGGGAGIPIEKLASEYCLSLRQFERNFKQQAGFSPRLFARIIRFQSALAGRDTLPGKNLAQIALDCGYYDQSHFIHDFKEFSGHDPRHYFYGEAEGTEWR